MRAVSSYRKKRYTIKRFIVAIIFLSICCSVFDSHVDAKDEYFSVTRVVDGDTLKISDGRTIRLIGIDTPEVYYTQKLLKDARKRSKDVRTIQAMGRKASDFIKKLCLGKKIRLEADMEKKDYYKRFLAYVYLEDGTFINAKIVEEGYAQVLTIPPNVKHADLFLELQRKARDARKGLWAEGL